MKEHFNMFAAYNGWANRTIYAAAAELTEEEYLRDVGVFFGSMHGTLNHLLVADRIWMKRFTGEGEHPDRLDAVIHDDLEKLREAREAEDQRISAWIGTLDEATLAGEFSYRAMTNPAPVTQHLGSALAHLFNHQTHHRGHAHAILSLLGHAPPSLDMVRFHRLPEGEAYR